LFTRRKIIESAYRRDEWIRSLKKERRDNGPRGVVGSLSLDGFMFKKGGVGGEISPSLDARGPRAKRPGG